MGSPPPPRCSMEPVSPPPSPGDGASVPASGADNSRLWGQWGHSLWGGSRGPACGEAVWPQTVGREWGHDLWGIVGSVPVGPVRPQPVGRQRIVRP